MRHVSGNGSLTAALMISAAVTCGVASTSKAIAQEAAPSAADQLPPVEVVSSQQKKKKPAAKKKTAQVNKAEQSDPSPPSNAPVAEPIASNEPASSGSGTSKTDIKVSGEPSIGTQTTEVTSADLERINPKDLKDVFSGQPGIIVGGAIPAAQKVYVNGAEETTLAVTIDGAEMNNKVYHHNSTNLVDPSLLKAVRVDAGVAPADAGFGALAGAIAYETKDVTDLLDRDGVGGSVKTMFNTNGDVFTTNLTGYGMSNGFEILGSFSLGKGDEYEAGNGTTVAGTETDFISGLGKLAYQATSGDRFEISHERFNDDAIRPYRANGIFVGRPFQPLTRPYDLERQTTVFNYSDVTPTGWWDPKIVVAYSKNEVSVPTYLARETYQTTGENDSLNGKFENKFNLGIGSVVAGADFAKRRAILHDKYDAADEESTNVGGYAQARLEPVTGTRVSFGGRADHQWFTGTNDREFEDSGLSGNISGEQDLLGRFLTARVGYSHVWAGVPLAETFVLNPLWQYPGGPPSVESDNYTAGLVARYEGWKFEGSVFKTAIDNARVSLYGEPDRFGVFGSIRNFDVETEGFELGIGYEWRTGFVRVKYANIDATIDGQPAESYLGNYLVTPFGEMITITGVHRFEGTGWTIGADAVIAPQYDKVIATSPPFPSYKYFNAFVEYQTLFTGLDLTLRMDVRNIFDELYAERANYGHEYVGEVTPQFEPGRSFMFSATTKF